MFSINIYLRFALIAASFLGGAILASKFGFWYAFPFFLMGIILVVGYFLLGTIQSSALKMQSGDMEAANKNLDLTFFPQWLYKPYRGTFYLIKGSIAAQQQDDDKAEACFTKAQAMGLPSDNERAMILLALANFRAKKGNWTAAENFIRQAKGLKVTENMLKEQITESEKAMKMRSQQNTMMMRQGFRGFNAGGAGKRQTKK
jgi:tetratricopeptide (TPR) repeat protein